MDKRLKGWLQWLEKDDDVAYKAALERLKILAENLETGILRGGNYEL